MNSGKTNQFNKLEYTPSEPSSLYNELLGILPLLPVANHAGGPIFGRRQDWYRIHVLKGLAAGSHVLRHSI
jgi:hypothetical protein